MRRSRRWSSGAAVGIPVGEDRREAVEQQVTGQAVDRVGSHRRGLRHVEQPSAVTREVPGEQRRAPRVEVRVARQAHVERFESLCRWSSRSGSVATATLREHDLGAQQLDAGVPELVERSGLRNREEPLCRVERAGAEVGLRRLQCPFGSPFRVAGERDRALEERGCRGLAAARLAPGRRSSSSSCATVLVGPGGRGRQVPGPTIRIDRADR